MKKTVLLIIAMGTCLFSQAQKRDLDLEALQNWQEINHPAISGTGKYIIYGLQSPKSGSSWVVETSDGSWQRTIAGNMNEIEFTADDRWMIAKTGRDSMLVLDLQKDHPRYFGSIRSFKVTGDGGRQWLAYQSIGSSGGLALVNLLSGEVQQYQGVRGYSFTTNGRALLLQLDGLKEGTREGGVLWHELADGKDIILSRSPAAGDIVFDRSGMRLAFFSTDLSRGQQTNSLRYYEQGMDSAAVLIDPSAKDMAGLQIRAENLFFNTEGDKIFFYTEKKGPKAVETKRGVPEQLKMLNYRDDSIEMEHSTHAYLSVIDLKGNKGFVRLGKDQDERCVLSHGNDGPYVLFESDVVGSSSDYEWRVSARPDIYLVSTRDGSRKLIKKRLITYALSISRKGKYAVWFDRERRQWFAYNISTGILKNVTQDIPVPLYTDSDYPGLRDMEGLAGWMENDEAMLIYDRFDIWKVDPSGVKPSENLTKGYGARSNTCFRLMSFDKDDPKVYKANDSIPLTAFNYHTKQNGFYRLFLQREGCLKYLVMEPRISFFWGARTDFNGAPDLFYPVKAKYADTYLISRMNTDEYPNLYLTHDFKQFQAITHFSPQKDYNWYTSELIHWKLPDGRPVEGILYKSEDFNRNKKYPVIFYYYDKNTDGLHTYIHPELSNGVLNIPWFVSRGYLVFVPDMHFTVGHPGESACLTVVSAARYLSAMPWVDKAHMGLQGHSFGGWETNYIVTRTHLFVAASSSSGESDRVGGYERDLPSGGYFEWMQGRIGASLWAKPEWYIENSPIFKADRVQTPLLIMSNKEDYAVEYRQGYQWYQALVRLGKKAWLLNYEDEGHVIEKNENKLDFTNRLTGFFDHYLKGMPMPQWMTGRDADKQGADFSGRWILNREETDFGKGSVNSTPIELNVNQQPDSIHIERISRDMRGESHSYTEILLYDGKETTTTINDAVRKISSVLWSGDGKRFTETAKYTDVGNRQNGDQGVEKWMLLDDGKKLVIERTEISVNERDVLRMVYDWR